MLSPANPAKSCEDTVVVGEPGPATGTLDLRLYEWSGDDWDEVSEGWLFALDGDDDFDLAPGIHDDLPPGDYTLHGDERPAGWYLDSFTVGTGEACTPPGTPSGTVAEPTGVDIEAGEASLACAYAAPLNPLTVDVDGSGAYTSVYDWSIDQAFTAPATAEARPGESHTFQISIDVGRDVTYDATATGTLTIANPNPTGHVAKVQDIDVVPDNIELGSCGGHGEAPFTLDGGESAVCAWTWEDTGRPGALADTGVTLVVSTAPGSEIGGASGTATVIFEDGEGDGGNDEMDLRAGEEGTTLEMLAAGITEPGTFDTSLTLACPTDSAAYGPGGTAEVTAQHAAQLTPGGPDAERLAATVTCLQPILTLEKALDTRDHDEPPSPGDWVIAAESGDQWTLAGEPGTSGPVHPGAEFDVSVGESDPAYAVDDVTCTRADTGEELPPPFVMPPVDVTCTVTSSYRPAVVMLSHDFVDAPAGAEARLAIDQHTPAPPSATIDTGGDGFSIERESAPGAFSVSAAGTLSTDLSAYTTTLTCTSTVGRDDLPGGQETADSAIFDAVHDETVTCTFTHTARLGEIAVSAAIDDAGATTPPSLPARELTVCLDGEYLASPTEANVGCVPLADGEAHTWPGLFPGEYDLAVDGVTPGDEDWWEISVPGDIELGPDESVNRGVTATLQPGSLTANLDVEWSDAPPGDEPVFALCIEGPSFPLDTLVAELSKDDFAEAACIEGNPGATWSGLLPGNYRVHLPAIDDDWLAAGTGADVPVQPGEAASTNVAVRYLSAGFAAAVEVDPAGGSLPDEVTFEVCVTSTAGGPAQCEETAPGAMAAWDALPPGDYVFDQRVIPGTDASQFASSLSDTGFTVSCDGGECMASPPSATVEHVLRPATLGIEVDRPAAATGAFPTAAVMDAADATICELDAGEDGEYPSCDVPGNVTANLAFDLPAGERVNDVAAAGGCSVQDDSGTPRFEVETVAGGDCEVQVTTYHAGTLELTKESTVPADDAEEWSFAVEGLASPSVTLPPRASGEKASETVRLVDIPPGVYEVSVPGGGSACTPASPPGTFETSARAGEDEPTITGSVPVTVTVEAGATTTVVFSTAPCGAVLGDTPLFARVLETAEGEPAGGDGIPGADVTATGTAGMAEGNEDTLETDTAGMAGFGAIEPGVYDLCVDLPDGFDLAGSQSDTGTPASDDACHRGVELKGDGEVVVEFFAAAQDEPNPSPTAPAGSPPPTSTPSPTPPPSATMTPTPPEVTATPPPPASSEPTPVPSGTPAPPATPTSEPVPTATPSQPPATPTGAPDPTATPALPTETETPPPSTEAPPATPTATVPPNTPAPATATPVSVEPPGPSPAPASTATPGIGTTPTPGPPATGSGDAASGASTAVTISVLALLLAGAAALGSRSAARRR